MHILHYIGWILFFLSAILLTVVVLSAAVVPDVVVPVLASPAPVDVASLVDVPSQAHGPAAELSAAHMSRPSVPSSHAQIGGAPGSQAPLSLSLSGAPPQAQNQKRTGAMADADRIRPMYNLPRSAARGRLRIHRGYT